MLDKYEAPDGFYAKLKSDYDWTNGNICRNCDARVLCQKNKNNWCKRNRCMSYPIVTMFEENICRKDGECVVFKKYQKEFDFE